MTDGFGGDIERAMRELDKLEAQIQKAMLPAVTKGADIIREEAQTLAPQRTGRLRENIVLREEDTDAGDGDVSVAVAVKGDAFYGRFLEFGTVKMAARPFLRPAVDKKRREAGQVMRGEIEKIVGFEAIFRSRRRG